MKLLAVVLVAAIATSQVRAQCTITQDYGCYVDALNPRTLPTQVDNAGDWEECAQNCNSQGYTGTAGMENGNECWCSTATGGQGDQAPGDCNQVCADDPTKTCGDESRLNEFAFSCTSNQYYSCNGNACVSDPNGPWTTPDCDSACSPAPPPPPPPGPSPPVPPPPGPPPPGPPSGYFICDGPDSNKTCASVAPFTPNSTDYDTCNKACIPSGAAGALGGGAIVLIIFFCAILIPYFVLGAVFMKTKRQATGTDMIPNKAFWTELPGLIKDGFSFTFGKITGRGGSGGSYQQI